MTSDRPGDVGWTPPRPPAPPRLVSGASPGSARGKLRSEYQARLGGASVKKRRAGPLKFPAQSTDQRRSPVADLSGPGGARTLPMATGGRRLPTSMTSPPPPPPPLPPSIRLAPQERGGRQTSLLDFCTVSSDRSVALMPGVTAEGTTSAQQGSTAPVVTPRNHGDSILARGGGEGGAEAAATAAGMVAAWVSPADGRGNGEERGDDHHDRRDDQTPISPSPVSARPTHPVTRDIQDADSMAMDVEETDDSWTDVQERAASSPARSPPPPTPPPPSPSIQTSPATPVRRSTPIDYFGLLGAGTATALGDHLGGTSGSSASGGSTGSGVGSARMVDSRAAVYSDRFIPARFGSVLESGSPFLATGGTVSSLASAAGVTNGAGLTRNAQSGEGANGRSQLNLGAGGTTAGGGTGAGSTAAARREAIDPGGIRGTEGAPVAGQGRGAGAVGGGAAAGGGDAAAAAGGPQYWPYGSSATDAQREGQTMLNMLLRSELLGTTDSASQGRQDGVATATAAAAAGMTSSSGGTTGLLSEAATWGGGREGVDGGTVGAGAGVRSGGVEGGGSSGSTPNLFRFKVPRQAYEEDVTMSYSISPISQSTKLLSKPSKAKRKIPKIPFKVLDAPQLQDDFYLNLVDWSSQNVLAVGLGACVYLWSACTSKVTKLCDLGRDPVASVAWTQRGTHLGVGTTSGLVQIWDTVKCKKIRSMAGHTNRVGTMSWNAHSLASGSRDRLILMRDVRAPEPFTDKLVGHKQEVCGLKWSFDDKQLASGGNDNKLFIWNAHSTSPVLRFTEHTAAVKAIAWSPHQHGILASGGGTADRCIRFWNSQTSARLSCVDTGSQVCNLMWSKNINEIVSTHGYSLNQIIVWRYPSMTKVTTLTGHTMRVLYLAMSPDGQTIVTGAGDETLRFWNAFPGPKSKEGSGSAGLLFPAGVDIR